MMNRIHTIKEVTVLFPGDSSKINAWSNIPYFFTETLIAKGIKVNRVDLSVSLFNDKIYNQTIGRIWRKVCPQTLCSYSRSFIHFKLLQKRIKKALRQFPHSDWNIFIASYAFPLKSMNGVPTAVLGDWTFEHTIRYFHHREPDWMENLAVKRESRQIEKANLVISLFPGCTKELQIKHSNPHIYYLGNVVNSLLKANETEILPLKQTSNDIVFIGRSKYMEGARTLLQAFGRLKKQYPLLKLHIVGLSGSHFSELPEDVLFYSYLDKGKDADKQVYYSLLKHAKMFVNTTPQWGTFSASVETMYFYTPVVVPPYDEFVNTFGPAIPFGFYCQENTPAQIMECIEKILDHTQYEGLCQSAHHAVETFTWDHYVDRFLQKAEELMLHGEK